MPKNTFVVVVVLAILAALVVGVNIGKRVTDTNNADTFTTTLSPTPTTQVNLYTYANRNCGISITYPEYFSLLENPLEGALLSNTRNSKDAIIVTCQKDIPRIPLPAEKIEQVKIGTVSAQLYHDASQNDGTPIDKLIFTNPGTNKDVYIAGYGSDFNTVLQSLQILTP